MEMGPILSEPVNSHVGLLCLLEVYSKSPWQNSPLPALCWGCCWGGLASNLHALVRQDYYSPLFPPKNQQTSCFDFLFDRIAL